MKRRILLGTAATAAIAALAAPPAGAVSIRDDAAPNGIAAYYDNANRYPNVAAIRVGTSSYCTGTLMNARTILTASHCFFSKTENIADKIGPATNLSFSPETGGATAAQAGAIRVNADYAGDIPIGDIALIALDRPVTSLTPVQLATAAPATGQPVILVGYGLSALGEEPEDAISDSRRRVAYNILDYVGPASGLPPTQDGESQSGSQVVAAIDFDGPGFPSTNSLGAAIAIDGEGSVLPGDSGGPMFMTTADGQLVQLGILSGGYPPQGVDAAAAELPDGTVVITYGDLDFWPAVWTFQDWLAANNFLQAVSATAGDGAWSSAAHWSGGAVPNNSSGYVNGGAARYYNVTLDQSGTTSLDMNAAIDSLTVNNEAAALDIAAPWRLTAEIGTTLAAGTLTLAGALTTPWLQMTGGTLAGSGTLAAPQGVSQSGGTVSPGGTGAIGTLSVNGSFVQTGGVLLAELSTDNADRLAATGAVSLAGGLQVALLGAPPPADGSVFTVASGSSMNASALAAPDPLGAITFSLASSGGALQVLVGRQALAGLAGDGTGRAVGGALDRVRGQAALAPLFDSLDPLPAFQMARALDQLGSVPTTAASTSRAASAQFLGAASQRLAGIRAGGGTLGAANTASLRALLSNDPEAAALLAAEQAPAGEQLVRPRLSGPTDGQGATLAEAPVFALGRDSGLGAASAEFPWGVWAQPYGLRAARRGDSSGDRWDTSIGGVSGGIDYRLRGDGVQDGLIVGASLGYARADTGYRDLTNETKSRAYQAGLYGGWWQGPWSADAGLGMALNRYESRRDLNFGTTNASAEGRYDGREVSAYAEGRYLHAMTVGGPGRLELQPLAGLQALWLDTDSYTETGAGAMNLSVASDRVTSLRSSLGAALAYPMALDSGTVLRPELRARWSHEFGDTDSVVDASFAAAAGSAFQVSSGDLGRDAALLGAGLDAQLGPQLSLGLAYDVQLQQGYSVQAVTGRARFAF